MEAQTKDCNQKSDSMELIISLLLQHPQINKVNVNLNLQEVSFTFLIQRKLAISELEEFKLKLNQSLKLYDSLSQTVADQIETSYKYCGDLTELEVMFELFNLTEEGISFFIRFIYNEFGTDLLSEDIITAWDGISAAEDEFIDELLENLKVNNSNQNLVGFRDENEVLVFTKEND